MTRARVRGKKVIEEYKTIGYNWKSGNNGMN
jgi:hypothetical protein